MRRPRAHTPSGEPTPSRGCSEPTSPSSSPATRQSSPLGWASISGGASRKPLSAFSAALIPAEHRQDPAHQPPGRQPRNSARSGRRGGSPDCRAEYFRSFSCSVFHPWVGLMHRPAQGPAHQEAFRRTAISPLPEVAADGSWLRGKQIRPGSIDRRGVST
jgi:hypothetical protein